MSRVWEGWGCLSATLHHSADLLGMCRGSSIPAVLPTLTLLCSLQPSFCIEIVPCCGLIWISLMAHFPGHHFVACIFIFCEETYIRPFGQFLVIVFLLLSSACLIIYSKPKLFTKTRVLNIFSYPVSCFLFSWWRPLNPRSFLAWLDDTCLSSQKPNGRNYKFKARLGYKLRSRPAWAVS